MTDRPSSPSDPSPDGRPDPSGGQLPAAKAELPPMGCAPSLDELYQYMDGALDENRTAHVKSHLKACGGCGELHDAQAQFLRLIEVRCKTDLPPGLSDKVFGAIPELGLAPKRTR